MTSLKLALTASPAEGVLCRRDDVKGKRRLDGKMKTPELIKRIR